MAAAALLLTAPQAFAGRAASARPGLLTSLALEQAPATVEALAPAYVPQGFELHATADPHPRQLTLFPGLEPPLASAAAEKLASGVASWEPRPNLQRIQKFVAETWWVREHLGPVDSPNLYQAFGLDPQNNTDPLGLQVPSTTQVADALDKGVDDLTKLLCKGDAACLAVNARTNVVVKGSYDALRLFNDFDEQLDASLHGDSQRAYRLISADVMRATELALTLGPPAAKAMAVVREGRQVAKVAKIPGELVFSERLPGSLSVPAPRPATVPSPTSPMSPVAGTGEAIPVRLYRGVDLGGVPPEFVADPRLVVDMPFVGQGSASANAAGWLRDSSYYWDEIVARSPEAFSEFNRKILAGKVPGLKAPVNDATFRAVFPQYDLPGLRGKSLVHHHVGAGGQAVAIPGPLHPGLGGVHNVEKGIGIWGAEDPTADVLQRLLNGS